MANMRAIRTRIKSVKNTQQITKAMKMAAVSKLRKTQAGMQAMRPFAEKSQAVLNTLLSGGVSLENPFITPRKEVNKVCYVLFVGNRGLCGVYNNAVVHFMRDIIAEETREMCLVVCGRWGKDVIAKLGVPVAMTFSEISDTPSGHDALEVSEYLKNSYLDGEFDEVQLVYQHYVSALKQVPEKYQLLPAPPEKTEEAEGSAKDFIFVPDKSSVLENVMRLTINNKLLSVMLEAKCGEHSSRMTAMTAAADNTKELIGKLDLSLNRARQAAITTEISEIVGGAAALKKKK